MTEMTEYQRRAWEAVLARVEEIAAAGPGRRSMRDTAHLYSNGRTVSTIFKMDQLDGTDHVYHITAHVYDHMTTVRHEMWLSWNAEYWAEMLAKHGGQPHQVVVDGRHYTIGPEPTPQQLARSHGGGYGHGGAKFAIRFHDGREVTTRNLWAQGPIPPQVREQFPDNATMKGWL